MSRTTVCPWWAGYTLNNRARRLLHKPEQILKGYILQGMTVMDVGCGMGYFTLPAAALVGEKGKVIAVDLQKKMLQGMWSRAEKAGLSSRIITHACGQDALDIGGFARSVDFAILFMMLHEVPDQQRLILELKQAMCAGGKLLFAEPIGHVPKKRYHQSLALFHQEGFRVAAEPDIAICRASVLTVPS